MNFIEGFPQISKEFFHYPDFLVEFERKLCYGFILFNFSRFNIYWREWFRFLEQKVVFFQYAKNFSATLIYIMLAKAK